MPAAQPSTATPFPHGATEVLVDIAESLASRGYAYPGDSRERYEVMWGWAQEFEADFLRRNAADEEPGETYYEDVDTFAEDKAKENGWTHRTPGTLAGVTAMHRGEIEFDLPNKPDDFGRSIHHLESLGEDGVTITRLLYRGVTCSAVRMRIEASGPDGAMKVFTSMQSMQRALIEADAKIYTPLVVDLADPSEAPAQAPIAA